MSQERTQKSDNMGQLGSQVKNETEQIRRLQSTSSPTIFLWRRTQERHSHHSPAPSTHLHTLSSASSKRSATSSNWTFLFCATSRKCLRDKKSVFYCSEKWETLKPCLTVAIMTNYTLTSRRLNFIYFSFTETTCLKRCQNASITYHYQPCRKYLGTQEKLAF